MDEGKVIKHTCTVCGKVIEVSIEHLQKNSGCVVCQQCGENNVVMSIPPKRTSRAVHNEDNPIMAVRSTSQPKAAVGTPPPHRQRAAAQPKTATYTPRQRPRPQQETTYASPRKSYTKPMENNKKDNKKSSSSMLNPHSTLGCLWRSLLITIVLLLLYIAVGYAMKMV